MFVLVLAAFALWLWVAERGFGLPGRRAKRTGAPERQPQAPDEWIRLADAAAQLYGEMRGSRWAQLLERTIRERQPAPTDVEYQERLLTGVGSYILYNAEVRVRRPPSPIAEVFDKANLRVMRLADGATRIVRLGQHLTEFDQPTVRQSDVMSLAAHLRGADAQLPAR
jgi:hypothetical protein